MDGPTLITQPPGYPEERPETDDMDGMLEHLADELEGKQLLEKPRVSKKVFILTHLYKFISTCTRYSITAAVLSPVCLQHKRAVVVKRVIWRDACVSSGE